MGRIEKSIVVALATLLLGGPGIWGVITCAVQGGGKASMSLAEYMERDVSALHLELTGCTLVYAEAMGTYTETGMRQDYREFYVPVAPEPGFDGSYKVIVHIRDEQSLKRMEPMTRRHGWACGPCRGAACRARTGCGSCNVVERTSCAARRPMPCASRRWAR